MNIIAILKKRSRKFYLLMIPLGIMTSIFYSGVLMVINNVLSGHPITSGGKYDWVIFFFMVVALFMASRFFQTYIIGLTKEMIFHFEVSLIEKLRRARYQDFEKIGEEKIYTAIGDSRILAQVPEAFINVFNAFIMVVCCLAYMFWTSFYAGVCVLFVMICLLALYIKRNNTIEPDIKKVRDLQNDYYRYLRDFLRGFKELKMSLTRNENITEKFIKRNRSAARSLDLLVSIKYLGNELTGKASWHLVLGIILFFIPAIFSLGKEQVISMVVSILYLMSPVSTLIVSINMFARVKISMQRIEEIENMVLPQQIDAAQRQRFEKYASEFTSIRFDNVMFEYPGGEAEHHFRLGPISLEINRGETIFITGGNGSGKSTFINLLTGLYLPTSGQIYLNDKPVGPDDAVYYSNCISAIFSNDFLFSENYEGFEWADVSSRVNTYIQKMEMSGVIGKRVSLHDLGSRLSKGQQKRLSMIYALLEERPVMILDEWAADQDPIFRAYFYNQLLQDFRAFGKTSIVVTHDDRYFGHADRLIKMDYGMIISDSKKIAEEVIVS